MMLLILTTFGQLTASQGYSQTTLLNLNMKGVAVEDVLNRIEETTDFYFLYNKKIIDVERKVDVNIENKNVAEVLNLLFSGSNVTYTIVDRQIVLSGNDAVQQQKSVSGKVTDQGKQPLPGVTVIVKGTTNGTITDTNGNFSLTNVPGDATLVFSFVGMRVQEFSVAGKTTVNVTMQEETIGIDEVVAVGYGTQRKVTSTAAVSAIKGEDLTGSPVANINNSMVGRLSGVLSYQNSGQPGNDAATLRIRGVGTTGNANALIVIDGIPQSNASISHLNPDEVESLTVLKDAAAVAPYGIGGANGVILITTKRGQEGKLSMKYDGYYGFQQPTVMPEFLDAHDFATQWNIANQNIGNAPTYTEEQLQKFKDRSDPNHYPNTDWVHEVMNFRAPITKHTLSFTGGSSKVRFYSSLGYLYQEGVVSEINYDRYNLMLNVDADVTNTTSLSLDISGNRRNDKNPAGAGGDGLFTDMTTIPPIFPIEFSNGLPAHRIKPSIYESGYNNERSSTLNVRLQGVQKVPFIPGLTLKGVFGYGTGYSFGKTWSIPFYFYKLNAQEEFVTERGGPEKPSLSESFSENHQRIVQGIVTYERVFGEHDIKLLGVYEGKNGLSNDFSASRVNYDLYFDELSMGSGDKNNFDNSGSSGRSAQMGWVYRADYSYSDKYLLQLSGRYDGHYYFAPGKRFAFFPSVSVAWRLSEENFIKNKFAWIDNLKLRASYGESGNLAGGAFQYLASYQTRNSYVFGGSNPVQALGIYESAQANSNITWETAKKADIGLDATLFKGQIDLSIDVFKEKRSNMLLNPQAVVSMEYGIGLSQVNAGIMENGGFDFTITHRQKFANDLRLNSTFNISYAQNKLIETFESESTYNNPNRRRTGRPLNTRFGLQSLGLYQLDDFDENGALKAGLPVPSYGAIKPGDIKYADLAGAPDADGNITGPDGIINVHDETVIGDPLFPQLIFGLNSNITWKAFDLSMLWQGAGRSSVLLQSEMTVPFFNNGKMFKDQLDYWTPENPDAQFTRLTPTQITNNTQTSSFWIRNGSYLRLKNIELGYTLPSSVLKVIGLKSVRVYVSGQNVLTFSHVKFLDPELTNGRARYYFQQKVHAFGINVMF
ncbi:MAG: TonB-dependent receptor [Prolixibacteraceae bacterium]|nr:TonB-dependent receptor [Prolixibacteraceae bacterium]